MSEHLAWGSPACAGLLSASCEPLRTSAAWTNSSVCYHMPQVANATFRGKICNSGLKITKTLFGGGLVEMASAPTVGVKKVGTESSRRDLDCDRIRWEARYGPGCGDP